MDITQVYKNLAVVDQNQELYTTLTEKASLYYTEVLRLAGAKIAHSAAAVQLEENVEGRYSELTTIVSEINRVLKEHTPSFPLISLEKKDLNELVLEVSRQITRTR